MWTMMVLLSFLTACGGSDSGESNFSKSDTTPDVQDEDVAIDDKQEPDTVIEDNVLVALGVGSGNSFQPGVALSGLSGGEALSASGSTTISVDLVDLNDNNARFLGLREVSFVSTCSSAGLAEFTPATIKASGNATATYKDLGCGKELGATDNVVVYIDGETDTNPNATARTTIDVEAAQIGAIQFLSAEPSLIALNGYGAGDIPSLSTLIFKVLDRSGNPMPDRTVNFELDHEYGGAALSLTRAITGADGSVNVILNAGAAAGTVRAKASVDIKNASGSVTSTISTMSVPITMATSLGDQNSFSLSADSFNPRAWGYDGEKVSFNVRIGDHYQNPVIDGTRVYFRASGGMIQPSCETSNGSCSVEWESTNPRPVDGYVTVVAFTRGQGDYQDANSNGLFDLGESFTTYGESFVDANGNGSFETEGEYQPIVDIDDDAIADFGWKANEYQVYVDPTGTPTYSIDSSNFFEEFIDSNNNGLLDAAPSVKYQGVNCTEAAFSAGHCAEQINLVGSARLQMSQGNDAYIEGPFAWDADLGRYDTTKRLTCVDASQSTQNIAWRIADSQSRRNHLPKGTGLEPVLDDVESVFLSGFGTVASVYPAPVWPVWSAKAENIINETGKTAAEIASEKAERKYRYLNARGHFLTAGIIRGENPTTITGLGSVAVKVNTVGGGDITGGSVNVDVYGQQVSLFKSGIPQVKVDVTDGAATYTLKVKNACSQGLPQNATLLIGLSNGSLGAVSVAGGANAVVSNDASSASISMNDTGETTIVNLTISSDLTSDEIPNSLTVSYQVPDGSDFRIYNLPDFAIKD
ncbi:MAG: hypothetical protein ACJA1U_000379 [Bermanella sp.]|jgi:hypothetical protein